MKTKSPSLRLAGMLAVAVWSAALVSTAHGKSFLAFESGPVRPLAMSADGSRLFAVNTPDNRLEIFDVDARGLTLRDSVPVGMEPVAVAARSDGEVWVVNHLSDSVSVVDVAADPPRVVATLLVGDEPRDVVFADVEVDGAAGRRAFISTAHRGQHRTHPSLEGVPGAGDPRLTTPGIGRADVWVFDAERPRGDTLGGRPIRIVELFGDTPRALAVSPDGALVYAAVFHSGNRTATVPESAVCDGFRPTDEADACPDELPGVPGGNPGPAANHAGAKAPEVGLIVKYDGASGEWRDELGRDWSGAMRFDLPDLDVFAIDSATLAEVAAVPHVGTVLFNMAVNPVDGTLYVANTEARNEVRFEGAGASTVQGHLAEARITVVEQGRAAPRHLNKHIDYRLRPAPPGKRRHSLATPLGMAVSADGETLYVAAFGSGKIGVFSTAELADDSFDPVRASPSYLELSGGGPSGLALDEARGRLYVATRFDNAVAWIDLETGRELGKVALHNPEPAAVVDGRRFLYDAFASSSNGEASCASCHVFGDIDGLAWDLGDPEGDVTQSRIPILRAAEARGLDPPVNGTGNPRDFHPMKGPMTTQSLRGLVNTGALHWRGDRSTGLFGDDPANAVVSFRNFVVAFDSLLGHPSRLSDGQMEKLTDFVMELVRPPNPVRRLDNSLTPRQQRGHDLFEVRLLGGGVGDRRCRQCHVVKPIFGQFGTEGLAAFNGETQIFKVPHLRNLYQKVGMFGTPVTDFFLRGDDRHQGDQVRGFGYLHDGSVDTLFRFLQRAIFTEGESGRVGFRDNQERRDLEQFLLAFDTDLAPIVGQQVTLTAANAEAATKRIELMLDRTDRLFISKVLGGAVPECELVVKGTVGGIARGALYDPARRRFETDRKEESRLAVETVLGLAKRPGQELTFTCVPPGSGRRMGLDRDVDGFFDRDELDVGTDPCDAASSPGRQTVVARPFPNQKKGSV